jgi:Xaa-Pro aminopeptidase
LIVAESRSEIIRDFLKRHQLLGWLSWRPEELVLQLGYVPYCGLSFLLYFYDGDCVLFLPELDPQDTIPSNTIVITYPWGNLRCLDPFAILCEKLRTELKKRGIAESTIGVLGNSNRSSLPLVSAEQPPLPEKVLLELTRGMTVNAQLDSAFLTLFLLKTRIEVERIRLANKVAHIGLKAWLASLAPGTTEAEAAATCEAAIHRLIGQHGIVSARGWAMVQSGMNTTQSGRFNRSSGRRFESGDLVLIELATCVNGYWSDLTRTEPIGQVSGEISDILEAVRTAQQAAISHIKPGISARAVDAAARDTLFRAGLAESFTHITGHHVGFRYHDPGFAIGPNNSDPLSSGMVITIEPGAYVLERGAGARIEDNVAVTDNGFDILSAESDDIT